MHRRIKESEGQVSKAEKRIQDQLQLAKQRLYTMEKDLKVAREELDTVRKDLQRVRVEIFEKVGDGTAPPAYAS